MPTLKNICPIILFVLLTNPATATPRESSWHTLDRKIQSVRLDALVELKPAQATARLKIPQTATGIPTPSLAGLMARYRKEQLTAVATSFLIQSLNKTGLPAIAEVILGTQSGKGIPAQALNGLWTQVAATWLDRAQAGRARTALTHISTTRHPQKQQRLAASIAQQSGDRDTAMAILAGLHQQGLNTAYNDYNLAMLILAETHQPRPPEDMGITLLTHLRQQTALDPAMQDLAATALGQYYLDHGQTAMAIGILQQLSHHGLHASQAVYALGKAYWASGQGRKTISLWDTLAQAPPTDTYIEQAMLDLPFVLNQLQASGAAISHNRSARQQFNQAIDSLQRAIRAAHGTEWVAHLSISKGQEILSPDALQDLPGGPYLLDLIASNRFHTALGNVLALTRQQTMLAQTQTGHPDLDLISIRTHDLRLQQIDDLRELILAVLNNRLHTLQKDLIDNHLAYAQLLDIQARKSTP